MACVALVLTSSAAGAPGKSMARSRAERRPKASPHCCCCSSIACCVAGSLREATAAADAWASMAVTSGGVEPSGAGKAGRAIDIGRVETGLAPPAPPPPLLPAPALFELGLAGATDAVGSPRLPQAAGHPDDAEEAEGMWTADGVPLVVVLGPPTPEGPPLPLLAAALPIGMVPAIGGIPATSA